MFNFAVISVALIFASSSVFGEVCRCPLNFQPLCGSNGVTYPNLCQFKCDQNEEPSLTILTQGVCPATKDDKELIDPEFEEVVSSQKCGACPAVYQPVCASNGQTYGNLCILSCAQQSDQSLMLVTYGECGKPVDPVDIPLSASLKRNVREAGCFCTKEFRPVCGSNFKTYANKCEFTCAQKTARGLQILYEGMCKSQQE